MAFGNVLLLTHNEQIILYGFVTHPFSVQILCVLVNSIWLDCQCESFCFQFECAWNPSGKMKVETMCNVHVSSLSQSLRNRLAGPWSWSRRERERGRKPRGWRETGKQLRRPRLSWRNRLQTSRRPRNSWCVSLVDWGQHNVYICLYILSLRSCPVVCLNAHVTAGFLFHFRLLNWQNSQRRLFSWKKQRGRKMMRP